MKPWIIALTLTACIRPCYAEDLQSFGLSKIQPLNSQQGHSVRGAGIASKLTSLSTQSMAFSLQDVESGSIFNLNATSQMTGLDSMQFPAQPVDPDMQAVGLSNTGGTQFGSATFFMDGLYFDLDGFAAVGSTNQVGGAGFALNFQSLLPLPATP